MGFLILRLRILNIAILLIIMALNASVGFAENNYLASPESLIAKFGAPDFIESTENDNPRPPFVSKILTYKKERVQFIFVADAPRGSGPPYKKWVLMGAIDPGKKTAINPDEALKRMSGRLSK